MAGLNAPVAVVPSLLGPLQSVILLLPAILLGLVLVMKFFVSPSACDLNLSILLVTMVVAGGISSIWGAFLGAVLLGILPELLRGFKDYDILFYGMILLLIMMFAPEGLWGLIRGVAQGWNKGRKRG